LTTDSPVSQDGLSPEEAEFFLESATQEELEMLQEGGYDLPEWEGRDEGYEEVEEVCTFHFWTFGGLVRKVARLFHFCKAEGIPKILWLLLCP
jgi:hypothetical protein